MFGACRIPEASFRILFPVPFGPASRAGPDEKVPERITKLFEVRFSLDHNFHGYLCCLSYFYLISNANIPSLNSIYFVSGWYQIQRRTRENGCL